MRTLSLNSTSLKHCSTHTLLKGPLEMQRLGEACGETLFSAELLRKP